MKWRKETNDWINHSLRFALTHQERDIYQCLRNIAGQYENLNRKGHIEREGYMERGVGIPYSVSELAGIIGEPLEAIQSTLDKATKAGAIEVVDGGCYRFLEWEYIDRGKVKYKDMTPEAQEYFDKGNQARLNAKYPDGLQEAVDKRIVGLVNEGKLAYKGGADK